VVTQEWLDVDMGVASRAYQFNYSSQGSIFPSTRGRCYDHNFLRFSAILGEKNWRISQNTMLC
jgi:hypothetical protein